MNDDALYPIGELSRRSGVPVKTLRYYADEGILPPSSVSESGYRMYGDADEARLNAIRALRALGFSLEAIGAMLDREGDAHEMAALQLELVETQLRALERQRTILKSAATLASREDTLRHLEAAHAAASLGAAERAWHLERWLEKTQPADAGQAGRATIRAMIFEGLPVELSTHRLEAWIRLRTLLDDEGLLETLRLQHAPFDDAPLTAERRASFGNDVMAILGETFPLMAQGADENDARIAGLAKRWQELFAKALGREEDPGFASWFREYAERTNDPRIEQFWNDLAILRGTPPMPPFTRAQSLLAAALR